MRFGIDLPPQIKVFGAFFDYSFTMGSMFPRLPDIQRALDVAEGQLGLALIGAGFAVALVAGSQAFARFFADGFVERYSPVLVARVLLTVLGIGVVLVYVAPAALVAYLGFALIGIGLPLVLLGLLTAHVLSPERASKPVAAQ